MDVLSDGCGQDEMGNKGAWERQHDREEEGGELFWMVQGVLLDNEMGLISVKLWVELRLSYKALWVMSTTKTFYKQCII